MRSFTDISVSSSSCISLFNAASGVSPVSIFPPGNSHPSFHSLTNDSCYYSYCLHVFFISFFNIFFIFIYSLVLSPHTIHFTMQINFSHSFILYISMVIINIEFHPISTSLPQYQYYFSILSVVKYLLNFL